MNPYTLIMSCEHAVNMVPDGYQALFEKNSDILDTHHAVDIGALALAKRLSQDLSCSLTSAKVTRLLIDCNRSLTHPNCFSRFSQLLSKLQQQTLVQQYYFPYRQKVLNQIEQCISQSKPVLHLSIHSFTPTLNGVTRNAEVGLLYDPSRTTEKHFCKAWQSQLRIHLPQYRIRMNYPYRGTADGFTMSLRKLLSAQMYLGIELECNQKLLQEEKASSDLYDLVSESLIKALKLI